MGRPVTGFLANDGSFHETEAEADFRDAEEEIRNYCVTHTPVAIDDNALLEHVEALADPIYRYLNAKDRIDVEATRKEVNGLTEGFQEYTGPVFIDGTRSSAIADHLASLSSTQVHSLDDEGTEDESSSIFEQPSNGHEPMPDVGSGPSAESVLDERESDGTRSGLGNARSLRSGETLAIDAKDGS